MQGLLDIWSYFGNYLNNFPRNCQKRVIFPTLINVIDMANLVGGRLDMK